MTDRRERHGTSSDYFESQPARSQQTAEIVDEELLLDTPLAQPKPAPGKKNKDLCKQNHWQPHGYALRIHQYGWKTCRWTVTWDRDVHGYVIGWQCSHEAYCPHCGKTLESRLTARECPDWAPVTETEKTFLEEELTRYANRRSYRKPLITGPTHYRKKKT